MFSRIPSNFPILWIRCTFKKVYFFFWEDNNGEVLKRQRISCFPQFFLPLWVWRGQPLQTSTERRKEREEIHLRLRVGADLLCGQGYWRPTGLGGINGGCSSVLAILPGEGDHPLLSTIPLLRTSLQGPLGCIRLDVPCPWLWLQVYPSALGLPAFCPSYRKILLLFHNCQSNTHFRKIGRYRKVLSTKTKSAIILSPRAIYIWVHFLLI